MPNLRQYPCNHKEGLRKTKGKKTQDLPVQGETRTIDIRNIRQALPLGSPVEQWSRSYRPSIFEQKLKVMIRSDFMGRVSDSFAHVMRSQTKIAHKHKTVKISLSAPRRRVEGVELWLHPLVTLVLGGEWSISLSGSFAPGNQNRYPFSKVWVGL